MYILVLGIMLNIMYSSDDLSLAVTQKGQQDLSYYLFH